jgi:large subunit ribosomal protein L17
MRHKNKVNRLSRSRAQRKALIKSLLRSIIVSYKIKTTVTKAKIASSHVEKLITLAKKGTLQARRQCYDILGDHQLVKKLFNIIAPKFKKVNGGYTRIIKLGPRKGDGAQTAVLELTHIDIPHKKETSKKKQKKTDAVKDEVSPQEDSSKKSFVSGVKKMFKK